MAQRDVAIGLLGLGTVGMGVYRLLQERQERITAAVGVRPVVKKILVRDRSRARLGIDDGLLANSFEEIANDRDIQLVVEVVGGRDPAFRYAKETLSGGKHLVMANKELLATRGEELLRIARRRNVDLLFEAAVAGGIPIIRAMHESLSGDKVQRIQGIINGTTNYIITRMTDEGQAYARALKDAQLHGYAEADPTNDVDGIDAAYKLAILAGIAYRTNVRMKDVHHEGIRNLHPEDIEYSRELGYVVKLLAEASDRDGALELSVAPSLIPLKHPLAAVKDAFNAVLVRAEWAGELMFYGAGAGQRPTASAVVADIVKVLHHIQTGSVGTLPTPPSEQRAVRRLDEREARFYLRLRVADEPGVLAAVALILARENISVQCVIQKGRHADDVVDVVFLTHEALERNMRRALQKFRLLPAVREVAAMLRVRGD
ncbi:MAG: homoserine dehydrogenase [Armatimonadetes bacterium]|nr:homoserine dehydrogenase [Armatimonadota bacterium]